MLFVNYPLIIHNIRALLLLSSQFSLSSLSLLRPAADRAVFSGREQPR